MAARFSLAKGNLALRRNDFDQAETQLNTAYHFFLFPERFFRSKQIVVGTCQAGAVERRRARRVNQARRGPDRGVKGRVSKKVEFLRGLITSEQAAAALDRGEIDQATELYSEAARLLKGTERGGQVRLRAGGTGRPQMRDRRVPGFA